jgi:hypothetical protein
MPLHSIPQSDLREHCKRSIEGLELWLRRLIHDQLAVAYGQDYVDATRADTSRIIRSELAAKLKDRQSKEPKRFARLIDAALLDEEIDIICNPALYKPHFHKALAAAFPQGHESVRVFLERLVGPRNALYHANPVSVHDAYRILTYSLDIIRSLKEHYIETHKAQLYNTPTVIRVTDSLGRSFDLSSVGQSAEAFTMLDSSNDPSAYLRCGDRLSIEVEVDPSFDASEYQIEWLISNIGGPRMTGPKFELLLTERYVTSRFCVVCRVISNKEWHRAGTHDHQIDIAYRVLPPP